MKFREWSEQGSLQRFLVRLVKAGRRRRKQPSMPVTAIIDSQSVRSGLPQPEKGIDGSKKVKGIKRHIAVDSNGYPLSVAISTANVHDSKVATASISDLTWCYPCIQLIKADRGYRGCEPSGSDVWTMECVKTNFGSRNFIPAGGRWVVERTFAWLEKFRRICRNYEKYMQSALTMTYFSAVLFMLSSA